MLLHMLLCPVVCQQPLNSWTFVTALPPDCEDALVLFALEAVLLAPDNMC